MIPKRDDLKIMSELFDLTEDQIKIYNILTRMRETQIEIERKLDLINKDVKEISNGEQRTKN